MDLSNPAVLAGTISTVLFVVSYLPMLVKAWRTRDLSSYSLGNLAVANIGNMVHTLYVVSLPVGPIWALHCFYVVSSGLMLWWWFRCRVEGKASHEAGSGSTLSGHPPHERAGSIRRVRPSRSAGHRVPMNT